MATTTGKLPAMATSEALSVIVSVLLFTNEATCATPLKVTVEGAINPLPLMVSVSGPDPAVAEAGDRLNIAGGGFVTGPSTAIVTVFEVAPGCDIATGTSAPPGAPAGTCALTWYSPTKPGASPEKRTWAGTFPMVTVGFVRVSENPLPDAG